MDCESLWEPLGESGTGVLLRDNDRLSSMFFDIQSAAKTARDAERLWQSLPLDEDGKPFVPEGQTAPPTPDWKVVVDGAVDILTNHSKDLWVASWMIEGLARTDGFAGMRDGFRVVRELAEKYWGSLYPEVDESDADEGINTTLIQISGLDSVLPRAIKRIPILNSPSHGKLTSGDYIDAMEGEGTRIGRDDLQAAAAATDPEFFISTQKVVDEALAEFLKMVAVLDKKCGSDEPSTRGPDSSNIKQALEHVGRRIRHLAPESVVPSDASSADATLESTIDGQSAGGNTRSLSVPGQISSRKAAYDSIRKAADFLEATEPHSPVPTLLREIIQWRSMSFAELMKRLIEDSGARESLFRRTGVQEKEADE